MEIGSVPYEKAIQVTICFRSVQSIAASNHLPSKHQSHWRNLIRSLMFSSASLKYLTYKYM